MPWNRRPHNLAQVPTYSRVFTGWTLTGTLGGLDRNHLRRSVTEIVDTGSLVNHAGITRLAHAGIDSRPRRRDTPIFNLSRGKLSPDSWSRARDTFLGEGIDDSTCLGSRCNSKAQKLALKAAQACGGTSRRKPIRESLLSHDVLAGHREGNAFGTVDRVANNYRAGWLYAYRGRKGRCRETVTRAPVSVWLAAEWVFETVPGKVAFQAENSDLKEAETFADRNQDHVNHSGYYPRLNKCEVCNWK